MQAETGIKIDRHRAPSKETLSFRAYTAHRRLNKLRYRACSLFQSEQFVKFIRKVEEEIENRRMVIRKDRRLRADLGNR